MTRSSTISSKGRADAGPRSAEQERLSAAKRARRRGRIAVWSSFLGLVLIAGGLFGWGYFKTHDKPSYYVPAHVAKRTDGIAAGGDGPKTVDVYVDYQCPVCRTVVASTAPTLNAAVASNAITLVYHPVAIAGGGAGEPYATRAAASTACASDLGAFLPYSTLLMLDQPPTTSANGLNDDQLVQMGGKAGIIDPKFAQCVRAGRYDRWIGDQSTAARKKGITAIPSMLVDGRSIAAPGTAPTVAQLKAALGVK